MADSKLTYIIGGGVVAATVIFVLIGKMRKSRKSYLVEAPRDTLVLRQSSRNPYAPNMSPFSMKLETYLRMTKIPYKNVFGLEFSPKTGKTPWAQFNGEILTDSQLIIEHVNKHFKIDTMDHLSPKDRAVGRAFQKMTEENTYWCMVRWRWQLDTDQFLKKTLKIPALIYWMIWRTLKKSLYAQGIGRLTRDETLEICRKDLEALSAYLAEKKFLLGDKPCEVDCAIFGMLAQFKWTMPGSPIKMFMNELPNLNAYCDRMKEAFWPDWDDCITSPPMSPKWQAVRMIFQ